MGCAAHNTQDPNFGKRCWKDVGSVEVDDEKMTEYLSRYSDCSTTCKLPVYILQYGLGSRDAEQGRRRRNIWCIRKTCEESIRYKGVHDRVENKHVV